MANHHTLTDVLRTDFGFKGFARAIWAQAVSSAIQPKASHQACGAFSKAKRPAKELKGFARATLKAGEEKAVTLLIRTTDLDYWDALSSKWVIESDTVTIMAGLNAASLPLTGSIAVR